MEQIDWRAALKEDTTASDLQRQVDHIAAQIQNGVTFEEVDSEWLAEERDESPEAMMSGMDFFFDALDVEWIISSNGDFLGARVLVSFGGPNIWIDTRRQVVEGFWWGDTATASWFDDPMGIDDAAQEWFGCTVGMGNEL